MRAVLSIRSAARFAFSVLRDQVDFKGLMPFNGPLNRRLKNPVIVDVSKKKAKQL